MSEHIPQDGIEAPASFKDVYAINTKLVRADEAVHLLEEMDDTRREQVLSNVPAPDRAAVLEGLSFPEDSAGRLMQRDLIAVPPYWSVGQERDGAREPKPHTTTLSDNEVDDELDRLRQQLAQMQQQLNRLFEKG